MLSFLILQAPDTIKRCPQLTKIVTEQSDRAKISDKDMDIRNTEVSALKMKVETLRWQLAQVIGVHIHN